MPVCQSPLKTTHIYFIPLEVPLKSYSKNKNGYWYCMKEYVSILIFMICILTQLQSSYLWWNQKSVTGLVNFQRWICWVVNLQLDSVTKKKQPF